MAFIVTAGLTLIGTMAFLLFRPASQFDTVNPINKCQRRNVSQKFQNIIGTRMTTIWSEALFEIVMVLSDQQLVTGTTMLATIIYLRNQGAITVYHSLSLHDGYGPRLVQLQYPSSVTSCASGLAVRRTQDCQTRQAFQYEAEIP